jgi:hypothetical protein
VNDSEILDKLEKDLQSLAAKIEVQDNTAANHLRTAAKEIHQAMDRLKGSYGAPGPKRDSGRRCSTPDVRTTRGRTQKTWYDPKTGPDALPVPPRSRHNTSSQQRSRLTQPGRRPRPLVAISGEPPAVRALADVPGLSISRPASPRTGVGRSRVTIRRAAAFHRWGEGFGG